ncbi:hypothetical protein GCM10007981_14120 [Thermocladium modestius]|uniref:Uncharacterized protein n=1 Tax=Thermocladium modestius TaxID=62609 RepID=A0A830GUL4_9CREN|nr:hypothetical protein [Thermocladium modestius]GGP21610.1 hypothetical protein GCM10007981_14120 [Thermocladium modestius]
MAPSPGQSSEDEERGPITPAMPGKGVHEASYRNRRTNVVHLLPNGPQERKMRRLAETSARLSNEVNHERRQQFSHQKVDLKDTWDKYYEKYKGVLGVNAQAVPQKNN